MVIHRSPIPERVDRRGFVMRALVDRGPFTIALQQDRDDIEMALLRRDQRVGAKDKAVLL
jgi:hypothetical protein